MSTTSKTTIPKGFAETNALFTTNLQGFKEIVCGQIGQREKHIEQEKQFVGNAPLFGIMIFRAVMEIRCNPTNPAWAGETKMSKALKTLFGKPLDSLTHESSCGKAYRIAYVGDTGPVKFDSVEQAEKAETLTREHYFNEEIYLKMSSKTLGLVSRIFSACEEAKGSAFKHPALLDACKVLKSPGQKQSSELTEILDRLDKKSGEYVTPDQKAAADKADAEKAEKESAKPGFNLADEADCMAMAGTLAKANLPALLSQVVTEAQCADTEAVKTALLNCAAAVVAHLTAKDGLDVKEKFAKAFGDALADISAKADAVKAGASANLAPGVALIK